MSRSDYKKLLRSLTADRQRAYKRLLSSTAHLSRREVEQLYAEIDRLDKLIASTRAASMKQ